MTRYDSYEEQDICLAITVFKGLDAKAGNYNLEPGMADVCQNWRFNQRGWLVRRPSYAKYNAASLGANPIKYLERIYIGSDKYLLASYDTTIKVGNDSAGTFSDLKTGLTAGLPYGSTTFKNFHYLGNGVDANLRTYGTSALTKNMGCAVCPSILTVSAIGAGTFSGTYNYKASFVYDGYQEGNASPVTGPVVAASHDHVGLSSIPVGAAGQGVTARKLYRTETGGSVYYYLTQIADNTTTTYNDTTADGSLDTTTTAPADAGTPPLAKYFKLHKERIVLAGNSTYKSRLYYSHISGIVSYPDIYPAANYIDIAPDDGDEITGIELDPTGYLCVFKKNSIRKVFTDGNPVMWEVSEPFARDGCWASESIARTPQGIIYLSKNGWRIFDGQSSRLLSNSDRINSIITDQIALSRFQNCVGHYHNHLCYLSYTDRDSEANYNNRLLVYDMLTDNFWVENKTLDSFTTLEGGDDWGELYYGDSVNGFVYQEEITLNGLVYNSISDFADNGTLSSLVCWGQENSPYLELGGGWTLERMHGTTLEADYPSATYPSGFESLLSGYSVSGYYRSPAHNLNAKTLFNAYWNEDLATYGNVTVAFRTSTTSAGLSGAWSSEYTMPVGSYLSAITPQDWLDFRVTMSGNGTMTPRMYYQGGYAFKTTYGITTSACETSIDADYRGGYTKLTPEGNYSRARRFEIDHEGTAGLLSCIWDMDEESVSGCFTVNLTSYPKTYKAPFPVTGFGRRMRLRFNYQDADNLTIKAVHILVSPQPERY